MGIETFQNDNLIGLNPGGFVDRSRIEAPEPEVAFGAGDKEGRGLMGRIKPFEIQIPPIDNIESSRFEDQLIEDIDVVNFAVSNNDKGGNTSSEIQKSVQLHSAFVNSEFGPREKRQTQIDGSRVQSVGGLIQLDAKGVVGIKPTSLGNENLGKVGIDPPIPDLIGMSQSVAGDVASKAHMVELPLSRTEACFDVSEAFPIGELSKGHAEKLVPARKVFDLVVAVVTLNAFVKFVNR